MFLKHRLNHDLVEVLNMAELWDPFVPSVLGRYHAGEEMQDPEPFEKVDLFFFRASGCRNVGLTLTIAIEKSGRRGPLLY
jgi:hypothetical protein